MNANKILAIQEIKLSLQCSLNAFKKLTHQPQARSKRGKNLREAELGDDLEDASCVDKEGLDPASHFGCLRPFN